ncbi:dihydroorotate dehydrogenase family protein [Planctopirus limnophila DSM 3776]|uniref:Dihydroorotate dehydrogenase n=2 Tax=Planctopirus limnophila TaxID=120 RepID=D5SRT3_PLAL2|nr:dihydroorotate dehydrogenase family protein [Planctopirus limnophila DSM 3776]
MTPGSNRVSFIKKSSVMSLTSNLPVSLNVQLGRLSLKNPILVASGTFGYAREMSAFVDYAQLGGIIPKTVTREPRAGNPPPRTVETTAGLLNSIGLDNDGIEVFITKHLEALSLLPTALIVNIAGKSTDDFVVMARRLDEFNAIQALELNISCPNVSGGVDYGTNPTMTAEVVAAVRQATSKPIIAKLTPNVTSVVEIARAAASAGADALSLVNTFQGFAVDWKTGEPRLGNGLGGLSGPAIKPLALRIVWQVAQAVDCPIIGVGGIQSLDDVLEFLVCGATAVQVGTANFYNPSLSSQLTSGLEKVLQDRGCSRVQELIKTVKVPKNQRKTC